MSQESSSTPSRSDNVNKQEYAAQYSVFITFKDKKYIIEAANIRELYFIEDIMSNCIYGKIIFIDNDNIVEAGPLVGGEQLTIVYGDGKINIEKKFIINRVPDISKAFGVQSQKSTAIDLSFIDPDFAALNYRQFSYSWSNKKPSEIIKELLTKFCYIDEKDIGLWEESKTPLEFFYIPRWNIRQTIKYLMDRACNEKEESGYLFFQNLKDAQKREGRSAYNLVTLNKLIKDTELLKLSESDDGTYVFESESLTDFNKILSFSLSGRDDTAKDYLMGARVYGYDIKKKRFIDTKDTLTYKTQFEKTNALGKYSLFKDISQSDPVHIITAENDEAWMNNYYYNLWVKRYMLQQQIIIDVRGHEGRYAGAKIEIKWPSSYTEEIYNKNYMGEYIIKSITHYFGTFNPSYIQRMVLIKNGYQDSNDTSLLKKEEK